MLIRTAIFFVFASLACSGLAQNHRVVVDLFTGGTASYSNALKNIENVKKAFGAESVAVEIVCHGPGIDLLLSHGNTLATRVKQLQKSGVTFAACANTLKARGITKDRLFDFVAVVDSGTAEVIRKEEAGWSYLRR